MQKFLTILMNWRHVLAYAFFGVCTTVVNVLSYYLCYNVSGLPNIPSTVIAWFFAVFFAFITNRLYVFESKSFRGRDFLRELVAFYICRLSTGLMDVVLMYVAVDLLSWNSTLWKTISNLLAIVFNYLASRFIIFTGASSAEKAPVGEKKAAAREEEEGKPEKKGGEISSEEEAADS